MYEDKTFENILDEMLSNSDVDTSEGSLMYEACAKQALMLEGMYMDLARAYDNLNIETMEEEFFVTYATDRGVSRIEATAPQVQCEFLQEIEMGSRFTCNDYDYEIIAFNEKNEDKYLYTAVCDTAGTEANSNIGELDPIDYVDEWKGGSITSVISYGKEEENIDEYKQRFRNIRYNIQPFAGNKAAYRNYIEEYGKQKGTVRDCIPMRSTDGKTIELWVVDASYKAVAAKDLEEVQEYVCPMDSSGEGEGVAPIGHNVILKTPTNVSINVNIQITLASGYSWEGVKNSIQNKINEYLYAVRSSWSSSQTTIVRISQIEYAVLSVAGILDCTGTTINGATKNIAFNYKQIPVGGTLNGK